MRTCAARVLISAREDAFESSSVPCPALSEGEKRFNSVEELRVSFGDRNRHLVELQSFNQVKKCGNCGKPNAVTLFNCNNCGTELPEELSRTDNVMFCFVFATKFPISIRFQTTENIVYDDLLALSRCHLNTINSRYYVPDLRFLFQNPRKGLNLVEGLVKATKTVLKDQFLANTPFMMKMFGNVTSNRFQKLKALQKKVGLAAPTAHGMGVDELWDRFVVSGFNCPPSQFLLHLQTVLLPIVPFQLHLHRQGQHFTHGRFFPLEYIRACLKKNLRVNLDLGSDPKEIIDFFDNEGIKYDEFHARAFEKVEIAEKELNAWDPNDFAGYFDFETKTVEMNSGETKEITDEHQFFTADKEILQNYGRPYTQDKPTLGFYKYPRTELLEDFVSQETENNNTRQSYMFPKF